MSYLVRVGLAGAALGVALIACTDAGSGLDTAESSSPAPSATTAAPSPEPSSATGSTTASPDASSTPAPSASGTSAGTVNGRFADDPVVRAFLAYQRARETAVRQRNWRYVPMLARSTSRRQAFDQQFVDSLVAEDRRVQGESYLVVERVREVDERNSVIEVCEDDDEAVIVDSSGEPVIPVANRWVKHEYQMRRVADAWKVHHVAEGKFECTGQLVP